MRFSTRTLLPAVALAHYAAAANHAVGVGDGGLVFNPDSVTAAVGDTVTFEFYPRNHSVVQSTFEKPCVPSSGGIYSGFVPSSSGESETTFVMQVSNTDPMWLYCSQGLHCQEGMVMVINPPSSGNSLSSYKSAASSVTVASSPSTGATGGTLGAGGASASGSDSSSASASAASTASDASTASTGSEASTASTASTASMASMGTATGSAMMTTTTQSGTVSGSVVATATATISTAAAAVGVSGRGEWGVLAGVVGLVFGGLLM